MRNRQDDRHPADHQAHLESPRQGADHLAGNYPREGGFTSECGFGHVPGQRWGGGYGGDVPGAPPSGRGFTGNDFGTAPPGTPSGFGVRGSDLGMGARDRAEDRGPHYGKGPRGYKRSDARILEEVCEAIADQGHIDATAVEVGVVEGLVTLRGTVEQRRDKKGLEHLVELIRGVEEIQNDIRLERHRARAAEESQKTAAPADGARTKSLRS